MNKEETLKEFKEILLKKPLLTLSEKCKACKQKHPELNRRCDYIYCICITICWNISKWNFSFREKKYIYIIASISYCWNCGIILNI